MPGFKLPQGGGEESDADETNRLGGERCPRDLLASAPAGGTML